MTRRGLTPGDWEVWAAIEELYAAKKTRIIGVSNVSSDQLALLCSKAKTKPMVVQNRCFAVMGWDHQVREICREHGILTRALGPGALQVSPPLVIDDVELGELVDGISGALNAL